jgi:orotidine-5'-phosphate decarboxylase
MTKGDKVICVSGAIKSYIQEHYQTEEEKVTVIPRGIDLEKFNPDNIDKVFIDNFKQTHNLKNQFIVTTVGRITQLKDHKITFATVHGNRPILKAANEAKGDIKLLAVTVLTSIGDGETEELGQKKTVKELVLFRGRYALELGCDGIICSGLEAADLRDELGKNFIIVTPGIRPSKGNKFRKDDQRRITTARQAIASGADYLVVGRPIRQSGYPELVVEELQKEISDALNELEGSGLT